MQTDLIRVKREEKLNRSEVSFSIPTKSATNTNPIRSNDQLSQLMVEKMPNVNSYVDDVLSSTFTYNNIIPTGHKGKWRQVKEMIKLWQKWQKHMDVTSVKYAWKDYHNAVC